MAMSQIPNLRSHIWQPGIGRSTPLKWQFYRFLLWEFIFGRPGLGRSTPSLSVSNDNFTDSYSESSCLASEILTDLPPSCTGISQIPTLRAHIWQTRSWQIFQPPPNSEFTDSYSRSSCLAGLVLSDLPPTPTGISQIPTLRAHIWTDQVLVDPPFSLCLKWQFHRFLLWELIFGRPGLRRSTLSNGNFTDSYSESSYLAGQVLADLPPLNGSFYRFLLWEFIFGQWGLGNSTLLSLSQMTISQIPTLRALV